MNVLSSRHYLCIASLYGQLSLVRDASLKDRNRLRHYQCQFIAHLDGMLAAEESVIDFAAAELARWKSEGELFAAVYLALAKPSLMGEELFFMAMDFLQKNPEQHFIEVLAQVFPWLPSGKASEILGAWHASGNSLLQRIALAALGLRREPYAGDLAALFAHEDGAMRAEACRYAGRLRRFDCIPHLLRALKDDDPAPGPQIREQAAIALLVCNEPAAAVPELLAATLRYAALVDHGGIASIRAEQRAQHVARLLGHAIPYPCTDSAATALLADLPPYLAILALAHHGNPALIPQLLLFLRDSAPDGAGGLYKRRALWAMFFMLGINPEHEGLLAENPSLSADWPIAPGLDQDTGLPEGDADKVEQWWQARHAQYGAAASPLLSGRRMDSPATAKELMGEGMQAQRFAAALHACRLSKVAPWLDTRAPWAMQKRWLEGWD